MSLIGSNINSLGIIKKNFPFPILFVAGFSVHHPVPSCRPILNSQSSTACQNQLEATQHIFSSRSPTFVSKSSSRISHTFLHPTNQKCRRPPWIVFTPFQPLKNSTGSPTAAFPPPTVRNTAYVTSSPLFSKFSNLTGPYTPSFSARTLPPCTPPSAQPKPSLSFTPPPSPEYPPLPPIHTKSRSHATFEETSSTCPPSPSAPALSASASSMPSPSSTNHPTFPNHRGN